MTGDIVLSLDRLSINNHFHLSAPTCVRRHLPVGGLSVGAEGRRAVRLVQVRQAGSKPPAQSVTGAGVAGVATAGQVGQERTPRRLCHRAVPAEGRRGFQRAQL